MERYFQCYKGKEKEKLRLLLLFLSCRYGFAKQDKRINSAAFMRTELSGVDEIKRWRDFATLFAEIERVVQ